MYDEKVSILKDTYWMTSKVILACAVLPFWKAFFVILLKTVTKVTFRVLLYKVSKLVIYMCIVKIIWYVL